jgi:hypothetical protein|tara:strand:+ start:557 stop:808 length:252 start_codon:yes stop_codon:yes gene_type:complete
MIYNYIYYNEKSQKVRCKSFQVSDAEFEFVGKLTKCEFDLLIEVLFEQHGDHNITLEEFVNVYLQLRNFTDELKNLIDVNKDL